MTTETYNIVFSIPAEIFPPSADIAVVPLLLVKTSGATTSLETATFYRNGGYILLGLDTAIVYTTCQASIATYQYMYFNSIKNESISSDKLTGGNKQFQVRLDMRQLPLNGLLSLTITLA